MRALLLLLIAPVGTGVAREQPPDMVTDRPDQTESAAVVPRGLLQVETGYLFARDGDVDGHAVPGTLFRLGLGGRLELRIGHVGIVGGAGRRGAGERELGAKINLIARADGWRPELALLSGLSLPTGDHGFSSDGVDPSFLVAFAHELLPRSSFLDWAAEHTNTPREVVEAALAHTVRNPTEAAYARSDLFERRRRLMSDWAAYLAGEGR